MIRLQTLIDRLSKLLDEKREILGDRDRSGAMLEALDEIRAEIATTTNNIVEFCQKPKYAGLIVDMLRTTYEHDYKQYGFCRVPDIMKLRNELEAHLAIVSNAWPCAIVGPPSFPLVRLSEWLMQDIGCHPFEIIDLSAIVCESLETLPKYCIGTGFLKLDWSAQRTLCDVARRKNVALLLPLELTPNVQTPSCFHGYDLSIEVGVADRIHKIALAPNTTMIATQSKYDRSLLEYWVHDVALWRDELLTIRELYEIG